MGTSAKEPAVRIGSVDAYRGFVMFLMMAEVLSFDRMAAAFPDSPVWKLLAKHQSHVEWAGSSLHDLIQPSFSFLVGVALPFSLANRRAKGQSTGRMIAHAVWRAFLLVALGIFLRSGSSARTNFTFEDTLTQIGLGYVFLFLLGFLQPKWSWVALAVILVGYWAAFALYPLPGPGFDYQAVGASADWPHNYSGFAAHWNKNTNPAMAFDHWFLNLFPRRQSFAYNGGGYATLSFIPTLGTMILGLIAGRWLNEEPTTLRKLAWLLLAGGICFSVGIALDRLGICPSVKRIWTPAWVLFSGGWCFVLLAGFYAIIDGIGFAAWSFPLRVIGMNSIAAYCMAHLIDGWIVESLRIHLSLVTDALLSNTAPDIFKTWGTAYEPFVTGVAVLLVLWLILYWMYRRKIFLRI
jgi:heparan-alpha-glucosaminide N-acetyltransferase